MFCRQQFAAKGRVRKQKVFSHPHKKLILFLRRKDNNDAVVAYGYAAGR